MEGKRLGSVDITMTPNTLELWLWIVAEAASELALAMAMVMTSAANCLDTGMFRYEYKTFEITNLEYC